MNFSRHFYLLRYFRKVDIFKSKYYKTYQNFWTKIVKYYAQILKKVLFVEIVITNESRIIIPILSFFIFLLLFLIIIVFRHNYNFLIISQISSNFSLISFFLRLIHRCREITEEKWKKKNEMLLLIVRICSDFVIEN